ncbi:MAG: hypothetical protein GY895_22985 [Phycisphaera sp.]|nr:hypothetical protein [Phycisphaera sp.]
MPKDTGSPRVGALLAAAVTVSCGTLGLEAFSGDVNRRDSADNRPTAAMSTPDLVASPLRMVPGRSTVTAHEMHLDPVLVDQARRMADDRGEVRIGGIPLPGAGTVDLVLEPIDPFTPDAIFVAVDGEGRETILPRPELLAFAGSVDGDPDSEAFLSFGPAGVEGWIEVDGIAFGVSDGVANGPLLIHRLDALPPLDPELAANFCGTDLLAPVPNADVADAMGPHRPDRAPRARRGAVNLGTGCELITLAIDSDQELTGLFAGDTEATLGYIGTLMAATNSIYQRDLGIRLQASYIRLWTGEDPWNAGSTSDELVAFRDLWEAEMGSVERDLAHFISGRGLGGGVAWLPGLCNAWGYGLSANMNGSFPYPIENNSNQNWDLIVFGHELGHNVGCPHTHDIGVDGCGNSDCTGAENGTIMSYCHGCPGGLANMGLGFCPENIANVADTLANASCDYTVTPETVARDDSARILPGESIVIDVLANDAGLDCGDVFLGDFDPSSTLGGTIELIEDGGVFGRPTLRYTAPTTTEVADEFQYAVIDAAGTMLDEATVDIRIDNPRPPVVVTGDVSGVLGRYYVLSAPGVLPDFEPLEPYAESVWSRIDSPSTNGEFADTGRADEVGVVWQGWVDIPEDGSWTFGMESDDGSRLWIGDDVVVDNDGLHGMVERTGSISLLAGKHPIRIAFFENGGGAGCISRVGGPGTTYDVIPDSMWSHGGTIGDPADFNRDGFVDGVDLGLMFVGWGQPGQTDLNGDGTTDGEDFGLLLLAWAPAGP